eukprot:TRINITY_DN683_c0_g1_i1.p2 TRINITY_DN683_c0_g1~~TRINITY_DN683_c0_g1_i1.p2  ORF type:complete len:230 (-),score=63.83 TRINITY_DN683_c0_g1_i1:134-823(-)
MMRKRIEARKRQQERAQKERAEMHARILAEREEHRRRTIEAMRFPIAPNTPTASRFSHLMLSTSSMKKNSIPTDVEQLIEEDVSLDAFLDAVDNKDEEQRLKDEVAKSAMSWGNRSTGASWQNRPDSSFITARHAAMQMMQPREGQVTSMSGNVSPPRDPRRPRTTETRVAEKEQQKEGEKEQQKESEKEQQKKTGENNGTPQEERNVAFRYAVIEDDNGEEVIDLTLD